MYSSSVLRERENIQRVIVIVGVYIFRAVLLNIACDDRNESIICAVQYKTVSIYDNGVLERGLM